MKELEIDLERTSGRISEKGTTGGSEEGVRAAGMQAFWSLREQAAENGVQGMSLDEINEEIRKARQREDDE